MVRNQIGAPNWSKDIARATASVLQRIAPSHDLASSFEQSSGTYHMSTSGSASRFDFAQAISDELHQISNLPPWVTAATGGRPFILQRLIPITSAEYAMPLRDPCIPCFQSERLSATFGIQLQDWRIQLRNVFVDSSG